VDVHGHTTPALSEIGEPAVRPLITVLNHDDRDVQWRNTFALPLIGAPEGEPLIRVLKDNV